MEFNNFNKFDTLKEFIEYSDKNTIGKNKSSSSGSGRVGDGFQETESMESYLDMVVNGYKLDELEEILDNIKSSANYDIQPRFDISGGEVEMGLYMTGEPECMIDYNVVEKNEYIHIVVGTGESASVDGSNMIKRAASITGIIQRLELMNYRVKLTTCTANQGYVSGIKDVCLVTVKEYGQPMSIVRIAAIFHPSYHRRLHFRYREAHVNHNGGSMGGSLKEDDTLDGLDQSGYLSGETYLFLPSITEMGGGREAVTRNAGFRDNMDAKKYADYVVSNIDKLTRKGA